MDESTPKFLICEPDYAAYRLKGRYTFDQTVDHIDGAIEYCRSRNIRKLLVNILDVTGFSPPTTIQRFMFSTKWAETAQGQVSLAMVAREEIVDPEKIGVTIARNRGLRTEVFTNEDEALQWLSR